MNKIVKGRMKKDRKRNKTWMNYRRNGCVIE